MPLGQPGAQASDIQHQTERLIAAIDFLTVTVDDAKLAQERSAGILTRLTWALLIASVVLVLATIALVLIDIFIR